MTSAKAAQAAAHAPHSAGLRVVMVVANDVTRDSRVLREAAALADAGHEVTVLGIMTARTTAPPIEVRDGFLIHRLPFRAQPPGWWIPPDFYARIGARAGRQYRLHRARVRGGVRSIARGGRILAARVRRTPYHAGRAMRMARAEWTRLSESPHAWRDRLHSFEPPSLPTLRLPKLRARPVRRARRLTWRREVRGLVRRARITPLHEWPRKTRLLAARTAARIATSTANAARATAAVTTLPRPRIRVPWTVAAMAWFAARHAGHRLGRGATAAAGDMVRIGRTVGRGVAAWASIATLLVWGSAYLVANRVSNGAIEWLTGWRWRWLGWARYIVDNAPDADVWHGHDLTSLPAVVALKRRRGGIAVYDSHEIYVESGLHADQPRWAKARLERLERELAAEVDAVVTVNRSLATILAERLDRPEVEVLYNCPARFDQQPRAARIRHAVGLERSVPLLLYHGALSPHRGIEQLLAAIRLPALADTHLAFLGFGQLAGWLGRESAHPRYGGRVHVLDAVPPDQLLDWIVGVDVAVAPIQASTLNHRYSSPNKVFEAIAAGTPVAGSDFPEFRRVIAESPFGDLGALFDPSSPEAIATAVRGILDLPAAEREALRLRCRSAAQQRWNWETESATLLDLYAGFSSASVPAPMHHAVGVA